MPASASAPTFTLDGKAFHVAADPHGDLILEGMAATWAIDREDESFDPSAFDAGLRTFLDGTAALCLNHKTADVLGKVLDLQRRPGGLWMRARVDAEIRHDPRLRAVFEQIRKGTLRGASVGGFFKRAVRAGRPVIERADLTEVSVTGVPIGGHNTVLSVVAGKAFADPAPSLDPAVRARLALVHADLAVAQRQAADRAARAELRRLHDALTG